MLRLQVCSLFAKMKPLKLSIVETEPKFKVKSLTNDHEWEITNAIENLLGSLAACEYSTFKLLSKHEKFHVEAIKFLRVESIYDTSRFLQGGPGNKLDEIFIEVEVKSKNSQEELDNLHKKTTNSCPVYQMLSAGGVKITQKWTRVPSSQ